MEHLRAGRVQFRQRRFRRKTRFRPPQTLCKFHQGQTIKKGRAFHSKRTGGCIIKGKSLFGEGGLGRTQSIQNFEARAVIFNHACQQKSPPGLLQRAVRYRGGHRAFHR